MASSYASTSETTNTNRVSRVVLQPCTDGLRDLLRHYVPPLTFPHVIKQNVLNLPRLTTDQRNLILPKNGHYTGNYDDMDISLLYILLRNISGIPPHSNGWGNDPDPSDKCPSANIERIRLVRNRCVHCSLPSMSNLDFNSIWSTIRSTVVDLDVFLMNGNKYENEVNFLRQESMDPENGLHYEEELRKQVEEDKTTRKMVVNLKRKVDETAEETKKLHGKVAKLTKSPIPPNVKDQYDIDVQKWREEDTLYYETHSFQSVMQKVRNQPYVTFVGVPGSGKSATAHHIALQLQKEGYEIVPTKDVRKMEDYGDPKNPQVFVIDDAVGVFGLQKTELNLLAKYEQKITNPCMIKSRTLMTCREAVFNETLPYKPFLTKEKYLVKLHSSDHALNDKDKKQILQKHGLNVDLISPALLTSTSRMFPLLCKLFSKETKFKALGSKFFFNPVKCIIYGLDDMQRHNKLNYATLVLCMLNENILSKDILKDRKNKHFMNMKNDTLENCELESQTDAFKFVKALSAMEGTYTEQFGAKYTFIHDSMFEICAYQYGKQFPDQMLLYMSNDYIVEYVKLQTNEPSNVTKMNEKDSDSQCCERDESSDDTDQKKESGDKNNEKGESFDLYIRLREDQYPLLAERLYRDIQNMKLYGVFRNQVLKHPQVCTAFIGVLETKSYTELKSLFLSSQGNVHKIDLEDCMMWDEDDSDDVFWERQTVLVNEMNKPFVNDKGEKTYDGITYNDVRVISWVIYYGHYRILQFIVQQTEQNNEMSELLRMTENIQYEIQTYHKAESESKMFVEACRLLLLSCYSGDVQIVRFLLPACKKGINGIGKILSHINWSHQSPLIAACEGGYVSIVKELVKAGADVNIQDRGRNALIDASEKGHLSIVEELVKAGVDVNLQDELEMTSLIYACEKGHVSIVEELVKAGADVNLHDEFDSTPLIYAVEHCPLSTVRYLVEHGADLDTHVVDINKSLVYKALILNKPDIVKYLIQELNKIIPGRFIGNVRLFNCLVYISNVGVKTDSRDDVVTDRSVRCMDGNGYLWRKIKSRDCDTLRHLLCVGLDVNQSIHAYDYYHNTYNARSLLLTLVDKAQDSGKCRMEKVRVLLGAGADVNIRERYREYDSVLDRESVSVLERTRQMAYKYDNHNLTQKEQKTIFCEIKKHVRRYSV